MALPLSRNTTYAVLSQVKSADLNALQDWIIYVYGGGRGTTITPTQLTASVNDYAPTGIAAAGHIRQDANSPTPWHVTGISAAQSDGRRITFTNIHASMTITLDHESGSSTAANRFTFPSAANVVVPPAGTVILIYDGTSSRWRMESKNF